MAKRIDVTALVTEFLGQNPSASSGEIHEGLGEQSSYATVKRALQKMVAAEMIIAEGNGKSTRYKISPAYSLLYPIDLEAYFKKEIDDRRVRTSFNHDVITALEATPVFTPEELRQLEELHAKYNLCEAQRGIWKCIKTIELVNTIMKNDFVSPQRMPLITDLLQKRESKINTLINNLKIEDVKDNTAFDRTTLRIKREVLLSEVVIGEGKFINHEYQEITLNFHQQVSGGSKNHYYHEISFPFTGSRELLTYRPVEFEFFSNSRGLIEPNSADLTVYVDMPELNPSKAIEQAGVILSMTTQFARKNNTVVKSWVEVVEKHIDAELIKKREQLIKLFGGK